MSVFPLNISSKEDHPDKIAKVQSVDVKYFETAEEINKKTAAIQENHNAIVALSKGTGERYDSLAIAMATSPLPEDNTPFVISAEPGANGQYIFDSSQAEGYYLIEEFISKAADGDELEGSTKYFNGEQTITQIRKDFNLVSLYTNEATQSTNNYIASGGGLTKSVVGDVVNMFVDSGTGWKYFFFNMDNYWLANHQYYVVFQVSVNTFDPGIDGNFMPTIQAKTTTSVTIGLAEEMSSVLEGETGYIKSLLTLDETLPNNTSKTLLCQFANFTDGQVADIDFENVLIVDLGEVGSADLISYNQMDEYFEAYGFQKELKAIDMPVVGKSSSSETADSTLNDIQGFGDSLMAQNYVSLIPDRNTSINGYGGQKSYYIRDKFLSYVDKTKTQIICVGRNNLLESGYIINDINTMVQYLGTSNFLVLTTQNGGYTGEFKSDTGTGSKYDAILETERRLSSIYQDRFFNQRKAMIESYDFGGIKLTSSFVQPALNSNVQIEVGSAHIGSPNQIAGTTFLNTQNSNDTTKWPSYANKITIGTLYEYDVYEIVSVDSDTLMTVKLIENNTSFTPNAIVDNPIDPTSGSTSIMYLNICQLMDVYMWEGDVVQSTLRSDGVHMSAVGKQLCADLVSKKLKSLGI
ncbi:hypothetical protein ACFFU1_16645 [Algibacter miyuki]|uniref:SGNH hydrolase-type esterase domain-containing protein n=1 Tax=Algibacter miyuki TaxID=1306933 RepID=A0ABV5H498_9FLAO|nr:hypothetical protein [Algibacter miyuki]MDN3665608.1 hypothetical protein [Algibacter miyuki]